MLRMTHSAISRRCKIFETKEYKKEPNPLLVRAGNKPCSDECSISTVTDTVNPLTLPPEKRKKIKKNNINAGKSLESLLLIDSI